MSPIVLLVVFCVVMTAIATWRALEPDRVDPVDAGAAVVVGGLTTLTVSWAALEQGWASSAGQLAIAAIGVTLVLGGGAVILRRWDERPSSG